MADIRTDGRARSAAASEADGRRLFPAVDRWFVVFVVLELVAFAFVPLLPLGVAGVALASPLRARRWRMAVLWVLAVVLAAIVIAPSILNLLDVQIVENGPVHTVGKPANGEL